MNKESIFSYGSEIFTDGLVGFLIFLVTAILIAYGINKVLYHMIMQFEKKKDNKASTPLRFLYTTCKTIIYIFVFILVLSKIKVLDGIGKATLGATGIVAVAVSIAAQQAFGNFISGFFLAVYRPFHVGDLINLPEKNISGFVDEITLRHTVLKTFENTKVVIPNNLMNSAVIEDKPLEMKNYSKFITVSVSYDSDLEKVKKVITDIVSQHPSFIDTRSAKDKKQGVPPVTIRISNFLDSGIEITFMFTCLDVGKSFAMVSEIREKIIYEFRKNDISIPYPTHVIYRK